MRTTDEEMKRRESADVVKLSIEGARNSVNTIREQQTGRGMSLVCPFPALEVNVPVTLGQPGDQKRGAIHRIGVEDDPETGLPRLRLSIRTEDERETVVAAAVPELVENTAFETTGEILLHNKKDERPKAVIESLEVLPMAEEVPVGQASPVEPAWIDGAAFAMPDELKARSRTRRRYHIASALVWTAILSMLAGGAVALDRAGIVDVSQLRQVISGFSMEAPRVHKMSQVPAAEAISAMQLAQMETERRNASSQSGLTPVPDPTLTVPEAVQAVETQDATVQLASATEEDANPQRIVGEPVAPTAAMQPVPETPAADKKTDATELTVVLPTRWPAEYATAYRVRQPNGVVVDVPGGLVKKEGWLEIGEQYPQVRSIKAVQRETGARFIVYTKGDELPRFVTDPQKTGVMLHLTWKDSDDPSEQLASL